MAKFKRGDILVGINNSTYSYNKYYKVNNIKPLSYTLSPTWSSLQQDQGVDAYWVDNNMAKASKMEIALYV